MRTFMLDPKMSTFKGVFYPTGYAIVLFPEAKYAEEAGRELETAGFDEEEIFIISPESILKDIGKFDGKSDVILPSVGTEGATVRKYIDLAQKGHWGLLVKAPSDDDTKNLMGIVRRLPFSYGQKYHMLAMEDLE